jgi:RecJ-like exonuclease
MLARIRESIQRLNSISKPIKVISHHDTDGITSAAIFSRALQRANKKFSLQIVKNLEPEFIAKLPEDHILIFLDLASGSLNYLSEKKTEVFIFDHHEISQDIPSNVMMINPILHGEERYSGAAIAYLFARELSQHNEDLATLAVIGLVGDQFMEPNGPIHEGILKDAEVNIKRGLLLYPATRPLDRALEYSSSLYIPGVTGSFKGVMELLREAGIEKGPKGYKSLVELDEEEMSRLVTAIMLRKVGDASAEDMIGSLYLLKFFNQIEDARELSANINACSRMGYPEAALGLCLGNRNAKKESEKIYLEYKQSIASALKFISETDKITGKNYTIINAQDKIKDTIIGTAASIVAFSPLYPAGTVIVALAYDQDKIKISARLSGRKGRNLREMLAQVIAPLEGEVGGHPNAAGGLIAKSKETELIEGLKSALEIELVKV